MSERIGMEFLALLRPGDQLLYTPGTDSPYPLMNVSVVEIFAERGVVLVQVDLELKANKSLRIGDQIEVIPYTLSLRQNAVKPTKKAARQIVPYQTPGILG